MRFAILIIVCAVIAGFFTLRVEPVKPDARLLTFAERNDPNRRAPPESAERKQIRQAMLAAANRLESSPCDKSLREPLRAALDAYFKARRDDDGRTPEEDSKVIEGARQAGLLPGYAIDSDARGPFACNNG
jgi:hypothetical protein